MNNKNNYLGHAHVSVEPSTEELRPFQRWCFSGGDVSAVLCTQCEPSIYLKHYMSSTAGGYNGLSHQNRNLASRFQTAPEETGEVAHLQHGEGKHNTRHLMGS